jgi:hypothetical protein
MPNVDKIKYTGKSAGGHPLKPEAGGKTSYPNSE